MPELFQAPIDASTRLCAVYGHPIRHSASPAMQNAALAALGLNWRYLAFEVHPENLRGAVEGARLMHFVGLNLTVPHKLLALELVDVIDEAARLWGAVNTIRFEGRDSAGAWQPLAKIPGAPAAVRAHGFNTDADALARSLREDLQMELRGAKVLLLGAGGAGRTAALKLALEGVRSLHLINRTASKAQELLGPIRALNPDTQVNLEYPDSPVDFILNATSLGLKDADPLPLDTARYPINKAGAVYDMIYRPAETRLLKAARQAGCRVSNGLGMLLYQGARALELWTGGAAPESEMRRALEREVYG